MSIPTRHYELAAELLLEAAIATERGGGPASQALLTAARRRGHELGSQARQGAHRGAIGARRALSAVEDVAAASGFEPVRTERKLVRLRNCPFHRLAERSRELICGMNAEFFAGVVDGVGGRLHVALVPWEGHCCVELRA